MNQAGRRMPLVAALAGIVLVVLALGAVMLIRAGSSSPPAARATPSRAASASPPPSPTLVPVAGVLNPPKGPLVLPADVSLSAPSRETVWAVVASQEVYLYRSTDRGATWHQRPLPPIAGTLDLSFVSDEEGYLSATGSPTTECGSQSVVIWHTTDAGATWTRPTASGIAESQCKAGLAFVDSIHGVIAASDQSGRPVIYATRDGAANWAGSPLSDPPGFVSRPGFNLVAGRARSAGRVLLLPVSGWSGKPAQYVYSSTDGGATWGYRAAAPRGDGTVALLTEAHWLQLIPGGQTQETTDGGLTWHSASSDYDQAAPVAPEVVFADDQVGYATVRGEIQLTADGGHRWTPVRTPGM